MSLLALQYASMPGVAETSSVSRKPCPRQIHLFRKSVSIWLPSSVSGKGVDVTIAENVTETKACAWSKA
jgi:hypothetical protein